MSLLFLPLTNWSHVANHFSVLFSSFSLCSSPLFWSYMIITFTYTLIYFFIILSCMLFTISIVFLIHFSQNYAFFDLFNPFFLWMFKLEVEPFKLSHISHSVLLLRCPLSSFSNLISALVISILMSVFVFDVPFIRSLLRLFFCSHHLNITAKPNPLFSHSHRGKTSCSLSSTAVQKRMSNSRIKALRATLQSSSTSKSSYKTTIKLLNVFEIGLYNLPTIKFYLYVELQNHNQAFKFLRDWTV